MKRLLTFFILLAMMAATGLTAFAAQLTITTCTTDGSYVNVTVSGSAAGDDGKYYLFELQPYEDSIGSRTDYAAEGAAADGTVLTTPLNAAGGSSKLNSKFAIAIRSGSGYSQVSDVMYLTNPEACASGGFYPSVSSKKGLQVNPDMPSDVQNLGAKHVLLNVPITTLMHKSGDSYSINMMGYDQAINNLASQGAVVTVQLLNPWGGNIPELYYTGQTDGVSYYAFNSSTPEGAAAMEYMADDLAERYQGKVANWILGNEVNASGWYYAGDVDLATHMREYERSFRILYNSVKARNSRARVFIPFDYAWNMENGSLPHMQFSVRSALDAFNAGVAGKGSIDWGVAYHPYPADMQEPDFWTDDHFAVDDPGSEVVNFKNLHVLTDYMQNGALLSPSGAVRHLILSEAGFTSQSATRGQVEDLQAAAYAYAYYIAEANPLVESFILNRQVDNVAEVAQGYAFGLWNTDADAGASGETATTRKKIYDVFKNIDTENSSTATEFAKPIIGISSWSQVIPGCTR